MLTKMKAGSAATKGFHLKTRGKILTVAFLPLLLIIAVGIFAEVNFQKVQDRTKWVEHTHNVLSQSDAIVAAGVDMETGLRGFLLAGQEDFLEPYERGENQAYALITALQNTVSDNPPQVARLAKAAETLQSWQAEVAQPTIALRREIGDAPTMNDMAAEIRKAKGKTFFDALRTTISDFIEEEELLLAERAATFDAALASNVTSDADLRTALFWVDHTKRVILKANEILGAAVDMETGMRGFLLAGEDIFLEPFNSGSERLASLVESLRATVSDNPSQVARLDEMRENVDNWRSQVIEPMFALRRQIGTAKTMDDMADLISEGRGKTYFDQFRGLMAEFSQIERDLMEARQAANTAAFAQMRTFIPFAIALSVLIGAIAALWIGRNLATAVRLLTSAMTAMKDGDLEIQISGTTRHDEMGDMARSLEVFRDGLQRVRAMEEAEKARNSERASVMDQLSAHLSRFSAGDLTARIDRTFPPDFETLRSDYNTTVDRMSDVIAQLARVAQEINSGTSQLETSSEQLSSRTEAQAATLEQTAAAVEELSATVRQTAESARSASEGAQKTRQDAESGNIVVSETIEAMSKIEESAKEIRTIVSLIDDIAFQTNLLALNAGVEAARAGPQGKGFAVVASEVQSLAQRSADAATEIKNLIESSAQHVDQGSKLVGRTGKTLDGILGAVMAVANQVADIAAATTEQAKGLGEINSGMSHLDQVTQQNSGMVIEASDATKRLSSQAASLKSITDRFLLAATSTARTDWAATNATSDRSTHDYEGTPAVAVAS